MQHSDSKFLRSCEQEPLHLSGYIQPHGALVLLSSTKEVLYVSQNIDKFTYYTCEALISKEAPAEWADWLCNFDITPGERRLIPAGITGQNGLQLDLLIIRIQNECFLLEIFPGDTQSNTDFISSLGLKDSSSDPIPETFHQLHAAQQAITQYVCQASGFQRVMYYQFREDEDGEVVAESRQGEAYGSYLGLRYPASDIPRVARALYLLNPWRLIPDVQAPPVPFLSSDIDPPDLSYSDLRSVSPVHLAYLANMGVRASLSFPVVVNNQLIALIAAHHSDACCPSQAVLTEISQRVKRHSRAIGSYHLHQRMQLVDKLNLHFTALRPKVSSLSMLETHWESVAQSLMTTFECDGVLFFQGDCALSCGTCFDEFTYLHVSDFMQQQSDVVWISDHLDKDIENYPISEIAGAIVIRFLRTAGQPPAWLFLLRTEHIHEVAWGGNPEKPVEINAGGLKISPRRSFEKWVEKRLGYSRSWTNEQRLLAMKLRDLFF